MHMLPLSGIRVLDFSQALAGPVATQVLADFGADVIKVERPGSGDLSRFSTMDVNDLNNPVFASMNRNKRSIAIDLRSEPGKALVRRLVSEVDVVVNNFRPGVMERLGFSYEELRNINPRLIYGATTGFGSSGPYQHKGGQEVLAQGFTGVMARRPDESVPYAVYSTCYADFMTAMIFAQGILLALLARDRNGVGQEVHTSLYETLLGLQLQEAAMLMTRNEELNWGAMPHTIVAPTTDGAVVFTGAFKRNPLQEICAAIGMRDLTEEPRFEDVENQTKNRVELQSLIKDHMRGESTATWIERLEAHDILCAPVRELSEALEDPQTQHNETVITYHDDQGTEVRSVAHPLHLRATPAQMRYPVPSLGANGAEILAEFGLSELEIASLYRDGVVV
ncbi:CaiB/BaiF CoA transferase family protein [Georgenia soli]|nr:CaiB/BaiF CoA-transferase family protein [Georgenia soli]